MCVMCVSICVCIYIYVCDRWTVTQLHILFEGEVGMLNNDDRMKIPPRVLMYEQDPQVSCVKHYKRAKIWWKE